MADAKPFSLAVKKYFWGKTAPAQVHTFTKVKATDDATNLYNSHFPKSSSIAPLSKADMNALVQSEKLRQKRQTERISAETTPQKPNFAKKKIKESWGDRAAWRRDSALNKTNGR